MSSKRRLTCGGADAERLQSRLEARPVAAPDNHQVALTWAGFDYLRYKFDYLRYKFDYLRYKFDYSRYEFEILTIQVEGTEAAEAPTSGRWPGKTEGQTAQS